MTREEMRETQKERKNTHGCGLAMLSLLRDVYVFKLMVFIKNKRSCKHSVCVLESLFFHT